MFAFLGRGHLAFLQKRGHLRGPSLHVFRVSLSVVDDLTNAGAFYVSRDEGELMVRASSAAS